MTANGSASSSGSPGANGLETPRPGAGDCWNKIGVNGDRSCPELDAFIHCRNCPVFAAAARTFFDRPAPEGYLAEWSRWLSGSGALGARDEGAQDDSSAGAHDGGAISVLIFRVGAEWLAFRTQAISEVPTPRPVHRIPHRSNEVLVGLVNLQGQVQLCVSLRGLLGVEGAGTSNRLVVLRDQDRAETWAFGADEVLGVHRVPRRHMRGVPSTLANPTVGFSQAVLSWNDRSVGLLDEQRVFTALRSLGH